MHAKVSVKGQIVIPAELREKYAIAPGDSATGAGGVGPQGHPRYFLC
jgi:hypothetical protein